VRKAPPFLSFIRSYAGQMEILSFIAVRMSSVAFWSNNRSPAYALYTKSRQCCDSIFVLNCVFGT